MSLISRLTTWIAGQTLTAAALNGEVNNIITTLNNLDTDVTRWTNVDTATLKISGVSVFPLVSSGTGGGSGTNLTSTSSTLTLVSNSSIAVTPKATTSRILYVFSSVWNVSASTGQMSIFRGSSNLAGSTNYFAQTQSTNNVSVCLAYLDSPATVGATTYSVKAAIADNSSTLQVGTAGLNTNCFLIELGF